MRLAPSVKYQVYVEVLTGQATQGEAADKYGVNRMTVNQICKVAKQGALDALAGPGRWAVRARALRLPSWRLPARRSSGCGRR